MATFSNNDLAETLSTIETYVTELQESLYEQYKVAYCIVNSPNFKGGTADSYKSYINTVAIYFINNILNSSEDLKTLCTNMKTTYMNVESAEDGIISQETLTDVSTLLETEETGFTTLMGTIESIYSRASQYVGSLNAKAQEDVYSDYTTFESKLDTLNSDINSANQTVISDVTDFETQLSEIKTGIDHVVTKVYSCGNIDYSNLSSITDESWYNPGDGDVLMSLWMNDPFVYGAGAGAVWEDQWAAGLDEETYAYLGASVLSGSVMFSAEDGLYMAEASGSLFSFGGASSSEYLNSSFSIDFLSGSVGAKYGWTDDYKGFRAWAEAAAIKLESSMVIGQGALSVTIDSSVEVGKVDAHATCEFTDENNFNIGAGASAAGVEASVGGGIIEVPTTTGGTTNLFGASVKGSAGSAGASADISSVNVYDSNIVDVNVMTFDLGLEIAVGVELSFTIPVLRFEPPWNWF